ncbi:flavodoxin family protein [Clostridiales bacterium COT073_COT-073]|nr:flavodoxin family protein [Clostridiales bacterium COT073_COT-073]
MNILIINGSPKASKSNTYRLTNAFLEGIASAQIKQGNAAPTTETLEISRIDLKPCLGCFTCWSKTPGRCCIDDDMSQIIEKLLWADITIWSFPLYYFNLPGQLKTLIDRQLPMNLPFMSSDSESGGHPSRYDLSGKKTVIISTCGFYTATDNYGSVTAMFDHFCGAGNYTAIFCGQGELFRVKELSARTDEYLSLVKQAGEDYSNYGQISPDLQAQLNEDLFPRSTFEAMADASWGLAQSGEKEDESLSFTRQMAALYNKANYPGYDIILEMNYTDIGKTYQITLGKDGSTISQQSSSHYTTRINTPYSVWRAISKGEMAGADALMKRLYQVEGDFEVMIHWDEYFGLTSKLSNQANCSYSETAARTNMNMLLIPWIAFWIAAAIHNIAGSLFSIGICLLMPLVFFKNQATLYDRLSGLAVGSCAIALLAGIRPDLILPLSYLLFGLMWSISCFTQIPLTAHYSMNNYNGQAALNNPIFMKTNRILTAAWGVLYLLTPIWTYWILQTAMASYIGAINSILPALMGIFTAWFQKWYPKYVASGKSIL